MKLSKWIVCAGLVVGVPGFGYADEVEEWKGPAPIEKAHLGALMGLSLDGGGRFALLGTASWRVVEQGFAPDINNQVYIETELGAGLGADTRFIYSLHMRWDFVRNATWTPFAIGGLSGSSGDNFTLAPRFGVGSFWNVAPGWTVRGEISHDLVVAGISFGF
jgi:hypothetical protein